MKVTLPRFERSTVFVVTGAIVLALAYWGLVSFARDYYETRTPAASVYDKRPTGMSIWVAYLEKLGYEPRTLETFADLPKDATIVAVGPFVNFPTPEEGRRLNRWVENGGRLVLVGPEAGIVLPGAGAGSGTEGSTRTVAPTLPTVYSDGVDAIAPGVARLLPSVGGWVATYGDSHGKILISRRSGAGEIVWLADSTPVSNEGIGEADNGRLAALLAAGSPDRAIYFDEYHHGYVNEATVWDRMSAGGRWALVIALVGVAVLVSARGRRIASAVDVPEEPLARTGAYIGSLAELYRKAGARADALEGLEDGLKRALARRHGSLAAGLARHATAREALADSAALRGGEIDTTGFVKAARAIGRARREVEG